MVVVGVQKASSRVTFIRYLTKITEQVLALVSPEHARALDFNKFATYDNAQSEDEVEEDYNKDHMFSFSVAKKNEQSKDVTAHPGFELFPHQLRMAVRLSQCPIEHQSALQPSLVASETNQAFLTAEYQPGTVNISQSHQKMTELRLRSLFEDRNIRLGEEVDDDALVILFDLGLDSRLPALSKWKQQYDASNLRFTDANSVKLAET
ncbi:hypothetical protein JB92DRAFT_1908800 [Gautieria morchelliformis]|nr:hypothetical protein JB92DRAFT_1908800 [Gautieria morchelliformis]